MTPELFRAWQVHLASTGPSMSDGQSQACARLAVVLLCGEQSAVQIFAAEVARGRAPQAALTTLRRIEYDEQLHEQALRRFVAYLPRPDDGHLIKRAAQRFFAGLGRVDNVGRHFGQISLLDSAVCKIMWHIEHSAIESACALRWLAKQIKQDEARHVSVSRRYAADLGLSSKQKSKDRAIVADGLIKLLHPLGESFETLGIDSDRLFSQIKGARR